MTEMTPLARKLWDARNCPDIAAALGIDQSEA